MIKSPSGERKTRYESGNTHNLQRNYDSKMTGGDGSVLANPSRPTIGTARLT